MFNGTSKLQNVAAGKLMQLHMELLARRGAGC